MHFRLAEHFIYCLGASAYSDPNVFYWWGRKGWSLIRCIVMHAQVPEKCSADDHRVIDILDLD
jgi:hypothetical protein